MFKKVLVANRGEIALRILKTLRRLGIASVAVYSDADAAAPYVRLADQRFRLGAAEPARSYLDAARIIAVAKRAGCDALHPGYGFLSENADFAQAVIDAGLTWIGPPPAAMRKIGNKVAARLLAKKEGVPTAPGSDDVLRNAADASKVAQTVGYPVLLKASSGGGGIGMRVVRRPEEMAKEFAAAQETALGAFGNDRIFLEKFVERPRHIELQVVADKHGNVVHFGERECSIQRRHQKIVEEAPSPALTEAQRNHLGALGVRLMKAAGYECAGTLEFLYQAGEFYFNEVNARLQVEHPVTEALYGVDLVEWQLLTAAGDRLPLTQEQLRRNGHAIELRINAEDPLHDFQPTPGVLREWQMPEGAGLRIDSGVEEGWRVPAQYDSLLAKVIQWAPTRTEAIQRLRAHLDDARVGGTATNLALHRTILDDDAFRSGDLSTRFLEERPVLAKLRETHAKTREPALKIAAALAAAPRGGIGLTFHRMNRPPRVQEVKP